MNANTLKMSIHEEDQNVESDQCSTYSCDSDSTTFSENLAIVASLTKWILKFEVRAQVDKKEKVEVKDLPEGTECSICNEKFSDKVDPVVVKECVPECTAEVHSYVDWDCYESKLLEGLDDLKKFDLNQDSGEAEENGKVNDREDELQVNDSENESGENR